MLFRAKKPQYDEIDGEYVIPIRLSEEMAHAMLGGWTPVGVGYGHLRGRKDGTFDLFVKSPTVEEMNAVPLDRVGNTLMAALDLAMYVAADPNSSDEVIHAANQVKELVSYASR